MPFPPRKLRRQQTGQFSSAFVFVAFALIALFFIFTEHRAHLFGWLPFLLLAACPLLHFFHRRHGYRSTDGDEPARASRFGDTPDHSRRAHHH